MGAGRLVAILRRVLLVAERQAQGQGDRQLSDRFVAKKDEAAFAALVKRHGRLVFGVCRSVLNNEHDAEDAFQATFLVPARMAGSICKRDSLPSWLYGVALRTAMKSRRAMNTRRRHEREAPPQTPTPPVTEAAERELEAILCEEIGRLPERYRAPFVLCVLQGKSRADAAQELGWKEGTVSSRIARARALLEASLTRRGVAVPALVVAATLAPTVAFAAVPVGLFMRVASAAAPFAAGKACESVTVAAIALAESVIRTMFVAKAKTMAGLVVLLMLLVTGGGLLAYAALPTDDRAAAIAGPVQAVEKNKETPVSIPLRPERHPNPPSRPTLLRQTNTFSIARSDQLNAFGSHEVVPVAFSPDSKRLAFGEYRRVEKVGFVHTLHLQDIDTGKDLGTREGSFSAAAFSPNQDVLAVGHGQHVHLLNADTGKLIRTLTIQKEKFLVELEKLFAEHERPRDELFGRRFLSFRSLAFSNDGKSLAVISQDSGNFQLRPTQSEEMQLAPQFDLFEVATGKELCQTRGAGGSVYRLVGFTRDGKILAFENQRQQQIDRLVDLRTGAQLFSVGLHDRHVLAAAVSPDGKRCVWASSASGDARMNIWDLVHQKEISPPKSKLAMSATSCFRATAPFSSPCPPAASRCGIPLPERSCAA